MPDLIWEIDDPEGVFLTFDDGPDPKYTPAILDILARAGSKATFFVIGANGNVYRNGSVIGSVQNNGNAVRNGSVIGTAAGVPVKWAAVFFFFMLPGDLMK